MKSKKLLIVASFFFAGVIFCNRNIQETQKFSQVTSNSMDYKKTYECKRIDFYKNAKLDFVPKGKCAGIKEYPNDIPLEVNTDRKAAEAYFKKVKFPAEINPSIKRETIELDFKMPAPLWTFATAGYAAPNEEIELEVPDEFTKFKMEIQIGIHTDNLTGHKDLLRDPIVITKKTIDSNHTKIKSKHGGPVIIVTKLVKENTFEQVPWWSVDKEIRENEKNFVKGNYRLILKNVVRAPRFKLGKTTPQEWVDSERCNPAPWAELESKYVTIAVPSNAIRNLNNPEPILNYWDASVTSINDLSSRNDVQHLARERFVPDVNISMGYMHSGYPVMTYMDVSRYVVDQEPKDKSKAWSPQNSAILEDYILGYYHELAHNRQGDYPWITGDLGEASTNIFVIKANCEVKGFDFEKAQFARSGTYEAVRFLAGDDSLYNRDLLKKWKNKFAGLAGTNLPNVFYIHLYRNFGFDFYKKIIAHYQNVSMEDWDKNNSCKEKKLIECNYNRLNSFALEASRITGKDMSEYFNNWGFELSWGAEKIKALSLSKFQSIPLLSGFNIGVEKIQEGVFYDISNFASQGMQTVNVSGRATHEGAEIILWGREFNMGHTMFQFKKLSESQTYQIAGKDSNRCIGLDKNDKDIILRECNLDSEDTHWKPEEVRIGGVLFYALFNKKKQKYLSVIKPDWNSKYEWISKLDSKNGKMIWSMSDKE